MSGACPCGGACLCHDNPLDALKREGMDYRGLTLKECALAAALFPVGEARTHTEILAAIYPGDALDRSLLASARHNTRVHMARLRPKLEAKGWCVESLHQIGYRLIRPTTEPVEQGDDQDSGTYDPVEAFLADAERQTRALRFLARGASPAGAAAAVGLTQESWTAARKRSHAFDACVLDALQEARRDRANAAPPPAVAAPVTPQEDLGDERCAIEVCGLPLNAHGRCPGCSVLAGRGHTLLALRPGALCPACHEHARRRALAGQAPRPVDWHTEVTFA